MKKHLMISIDWYGPYKGLENAKKSAHNDGYLHGLYLCIGACDGQDEAIIQYIGIGRRLSTRLHKEHHKLRRVVKDVEIWLGEVGTPEPSGIKLKATKTTLDYAEWLHARFMAIPLNDRKTKSAPNRSVTVLNRWWKIDYQTMRRNRPHKDWPDLIDFPAYDLPARTVWFGGKLKRFVAPAYARPI